MPDPTTKPPTLIPPSIIPLVVHKATPESDPIISNGQPGAIRKFLNSGIQASIDAALATLPEGKHGAIILYAKDKTSGSQEAGIAFMAKLGDHWSASLAINTDLKGSFDKEAAVRFSW